MLLQLILHDIFQLMCGQFEDIFHTCLPYIPTNTFSPDFYNRFHFLPIKPDGNEYLFLRGKIVCDDGRSLNKIHNLQWVLLLMNHPHFCAYMLQLQTEMHQTYYRGQ